MENEAFVPIMAQDGQWTVLRLKHRETPPIVERGEMSFGDAEIQANDKNRATGIPSEVWWTIGEWLKNADV